MYREFRGTGSVMWLLLGLCGPVVLLASLFEFTPAPKWFCVMAVAVSFGIPVRLAFLRGRGWLRWRSALRSFAGVSGDEGIALRLIGDYAPFSIEAANELGKLRDLSGAPILMYGIERLIADEPGGWREMISAMVGALREIGDPKALPLLQRLQKMRGADEITGLTATIAELEHLIGLLRPTECETQSGEILVRPVMPQTGDVQKEVLLRASNKNPEV